LGDPTKVKLGACNVSYGGTDLGYTKGGASISLQTDIKDLTVDKYGTNPIKSIIVGKRCEVTVNLAESAYTTLNTLLGTTKRTWTDLKGTPVSLILTARITGIKPVITIANAVPVGNLGMSIGTPDGEWVYPVKFIGYALSSGTESDILSFSQVF
jgi:hypothetical protein